MKWLGTPKKTRPTLGFALMIRNPRLGIQWVGSPHEILSAAEIEGFKLREVIDDSDSEITSSPVYQRQPDLVLRGGTLTPSLMALVEAVEERDVQGLDQLIVNSPHLRETTEPEIVIPLLLSIINDEFEVAERLVRKGVGVEGEADFGMTPLHWAAVVGSPRIVRILVECGASVERRSWFLIDAAELARLNGRGKIIKSLGRTRGDVTQITSDETLRRMLKSSDEVSGTW